MTGDHLLVGACFSMKLRESPRDIAVRDPVESVAPNFLFGQILVRQSVGVSVRRQRVVEGGIEDGYMCCVRHVLAGGPKCFEAVRIVERGENAEFVDLFLYFGVDDHGLGELISTM